MRGQTCLSPAFWPEKGVGPVKRALGFVVLAVLLVGCTTPSTKIVGMSLGMSPDEVREVMGSPFAVRAAKVYEGGMTAEVWEYVPPVFSRAAFSDKYDKTYWVFFEAGRVVQWGEPGDFSGTDTVGAVPVKDYSERKLTR